MWKINYDNNFWFFWVDILVSFIVKLEIFLDFIFFSSFVLGCMVLF